MPDQILIVEDDKKTASLIVLSGGDTRWNE